MKVVAAFLLLAAANGLWMAALTDLRPRLFVIKGCSGSSYLINKIASDLLRLHNMSLYNPDHPKGPEGVYTELHSYLPYLQAVDPSFANATSPADDGRIFNANIKLANEQNRVYLTKLLPQFMSAKDVQKEVAASGALIVQASRSNMLDMLTCEVSDCIHDACPNVGIQVNPAGAQTCDPNSKNTGSELTSDCFNLHRHSANGHELMAKLDISTIQSDFEKKYDSDNKYDYVGPEATFTTEELFEFEWDRTEEGLMTSLQAWTGVMAAWGVLPDEQVIRTYLADSDTYPAPAPQARKISNDDDVRVWACGVQAPSLQAPSLPTPLPMWDRREEYISFFRPPLVCDGAVEATSDSLFLSEVTEEQHFYEGSGGKGRQVLTALLPAAICVIALLALLALLLTAEGTKGKGETQARGKKTQISLNSASAGILL
jgi:hypothetical protein